MLALPSEGRGGLRGVEGRYEKEEEGEKEEERKRELGVGWVM